MKVSIGALIIGSTEATSFRRRPAHTSSLTGHLSKGAELNRVYLNVRFSEVVEVSLVAGAPTRVINTVSQKDYRSSPFDAGQLLIERKIKGIVQPRAPARFDI